MSDRISAHDISFDFAPRGGVLRQFTVTDERAAISPLHQAPWTSGEAPPDAPPHQAWLAGDFLAAPTEASADGLHGLTANGDWQVSRRC